ncbi:N-acetylglucosamine-1-phosphotransferase subunits alpha/beta-like isoform X2 [Babylonia areolata]|uniref:N-acetylglucosamine-1-phosphotransferase subunits alpha/beta-like isoform X2 n=1 Tax=Babylonia areolata TaxID=304850 RepID=UPI003FD23045
MEPQVWKLVQKRTYDLLSHRYGLLMVLVGGIVITVSAFHFGEAMLEWSHEKYATVFNSFSDNLAGRSYRERLCLPVPIDVVYTWVNGSDPELILQLRKVKMSMEEKLNISRPGQCTYSNCVPSPVVVVAGFPLTDHNLREVKAAFSLNATHAFNYTALMSSGKVDSLALELASWEQAKPFDGQKHQREGVNYTLIQAYYTSDTTLPHATVMKDKVLMTGFPHEYTSDRVLGILPEDHRKNIVKVEVHADKGVAVLHMAASKAADSILQLRNFTIEGKTPAFTMAFMLSDLTDLSRDSDVSNSRFEDNEELRYSLRSLERFAPWVRHVYIVTNGQIPYWLNLDNPRITVVTHQELFPNKSHLPTFSSPAIESHLHRIPGLSDKFLYLNDDVMFGSEVWPDDFYTYATGQKLYLTWPVPSCNEGCPSNWIRDGYCDKACNSSECEWDGGDCTGANGHVQLGAGFQAAFGQQAPNPEDYCHTGCANNWIADKYCDQACNHLPCGFDAGDCGTGGYDQMFGLMLQKELDAIQQYAIPEGETLAFFNLTEVLGAAGKVTSAHHKPSKAVRVAAVSNKFRVLTLLLYADRNATQLSFHLKGYRSGEADKFELNFTVSVDTSVQSVARKKAADLRAANRTEEAEEEAGVVLFEEYPKDILSPHVGSPVLREQGAVQFPFNISSNLTLLGLSPGLHKALSLVLTEWAQGEYTEVGFQIALADVHRQFLPEIKAWSPPPQQHHAGARAGAGAGAGAGEKAEKDAQNLQKKDSERGEEEEEEGNLNAAVPKGHRKLLASQGMDGGGERRDTESDNVVKLGGVDVGEEREKEEEEREKEEKEEGEKKEEGAEEEGEGRGRYLSDEEFLKYLKEQGSLQRAGEPDGGLPSHVQRAFSQLRKRQKELQQATVYEIDNRKGRQLLDTFGDSLRHVNRLYNKLFGYAARKVPAHMPHMIDKHIMAELQAIYPAEWEVTSSHKVRSPDDMQFAFSYYYYVLGAVQPIEPDQVFDEMDTDHSGILSDRELRTLVTRLNDLPLYLETLTSMENTFINCSKNLTEDVAHRYSQQTLALPSEQYYEQQMPQVTKLLFTTCEAMVKQVKDKFKARPKYRTTVLDDSSVAFKMIHGNVSKVVGQLDDIRKNPKKFICLNDNIDHSSEEAKTVKAVVQDFYESMLPVPSQFELPREYRNRFLHMDDLTEWKQYRDWLRFWAHLALVVLVLFTIASYFGDKIEALQRRWSRTRIQSDASSSTSTSSSSRDEGETCVPTKAPPLLSV